MVSLVGELGMPVSLVVIAFHILLVYRYAAGGLLRSPLRLVVLLYAFIEEWNVVRICNEFAQNSGPTAKGVDAFTVHFVWPVPINGDWIAPSLFDPSPVAALMRMQIVALILLGTARMTWAAFIPSNKLAYILATVAHLIETVWIVVERNIYHDREGSTERVMRLTLLVLVGGAAAVQIARYPAYCNDHSQPDPSSKDHTKKVR